MRITELVGSYGFKYNKEDKFELGALVKRLGVLVNASSLLEAVACSQKYVDNYAKIDEGKLSNKEYIQNLIDKGYIYVSTDDEETLSDSGEKYNYYLDYIYQVK